METGGPSLARVVVVDDDRNFLSSLNRSLRLLDPHMDITVVHTPSEVMARLSEGGEIVIVSDWLMPDMTGLELCAEARAHAAKVSDLEIYFILFSGRGRTEEALDALANQVDDYVSKPIEMRELFSRIRVGQRYLASRREILEAKKAAEEAGASKARFLASMSHEIRTPLQAISTMSELLLMEDLEPEAKDRLETVRLCARTLVELVSGALDIAKFEAGKLRLNISRVRPYRMLNEVAEILSPLAAEKGLDIHVRLDDDVPIEVETDPIRLRQVLFNLVGNAIKYSDGQMVDLHGAFEHICDRTGRLVLEVVDTGGGMTKEQADLLFQEYRQLDSGVAPDVVGTGLGLSISKDLATMLGGRIEIDSILGEGSTFRLVLPVEICLERAGSTVPASPFSLMPDPPTYAEGDADRRKVLLIDDDVISTKVTVAMLEGLGHEVETAKNARKGKEMAEAGSYDVLLVDVELGGVDGITLGEEIIAGHREKGVSSTRVFAYSGHVEDSYRTRAKAAGFHGFITKPCTIDELDEIICEDVVPPSAGSTD